VNLFNDPIVRRDPEIFDVGSPLIDLVSGGMLVTGSGGMVMGYLAAVSKNIREMLGIRASSLGCASRNTRTIPQTGVDFLSLRSAAQWIQTKKPSVVIHGASPADPADYIRDPVGCLDTNVTLTRELAMACALSGSCLIYISSGEVYGSDPKTPTSENNYSALDHTSARNVYAEAKRAGEAYVLSFARSEGLNTRIVRLFHTFGPGIRRSDSRVFGGLIDAALARRPFEMKSNGSKVRTLLYSFDAVSGIAYVHGRLPSMSVVNVAGSESHSIGEVADVAMSAMVPDLREKPVRLGEEAPTHQSQVDKNVPSIDLLLSTGWRPQVPLDVAFQRTLESAAWQREHGEAT
jgi:nucleoside-diphosphate-sugar epimerase